MRSLTVFLSVAAVLVALNLQAKGQKRSPADDRLALKALSADTLSADANVIAVGDAVYNVTLTAKGPVATKKQVVKPSALVVLSSPSNATLYYAKLSTKKYQGAICYTNDGRGRPRQSYAVAWDAVRKEPLGLVRMEMFNALDVPGAVLASVSDYATRRFEALSSSCVMADNTMLPYMALASGSAMPYTYLDGWGAFGANGANFDGGLAMAWVSPNVLALVRSLLGDGSIANAFGNLTELKERLIKQADLKGALSAVGSLVTDGFGFGIAGGVGFGQVAFDKKTGAHTITGVTGSSFAFDMDTTYVPYEVWNIYNGRSLTHMMEEYNAYYVSRWEHDQRVWDHGDDGMTSDGFVEDPTIFGYAIGVPWPYNSYPEMLKLCEMAVNVRAFRGYGTFSVKYNKSASKALSAETDPEARIAAFLKAAKAPKYVSAANVMDLRANYLGYMFNGRMERCASFDLPGSDENGLTTISPMTAANVIWETSRLLRLFDAENNRLEIVDDGVGAPRVRFELFGQGRTFPEEDAVVARDFGWSASEPVRVVGLEALDAALEQAAVRAETPTFGGEDGKARAYDYRYMRTIIRGAELTRRDGIEPLLESAREARDRGIR